jgi:hypothetical protein
MAGRSLIVASLVGSGVLLSGCATIHDRSLAPARVRIDSDPSGADVFIGNRRVGTTPTPVGVSDFGNLQLPIRPGVVDASPFRPAHFAVVTFETENR